MTIHLFTTSDMNGARKDELLRLFRSIEANAHSLDQPIRSVLLLQNCSPAEKESLEKIAPEACSLMSIPGRCSLSAARNLMLENIRAQGALLDDDVVGFPDDDCWFPAHFIGRLLRIFRERPNLNVFFCRTSLCPDEGDFSTGDLTAATIPQIVRLSSSNNVFYRGSALKSVGLFDPDLGVGARLGGGEDTDFMIRAVLGFGPASFIDRKLIGHPEPGKVYAVKYFRSSLVVLMRYAHRRPQLMLECFRKVCVGLVFATRGAISFRYYFESFVLGARTKAFAIDRGVS